MTKFNFIESANVVLKSVGTEVRGANREYTSISRVLKDMQRKDLLKAGYGKAFEAVGMEGGNITPKEFREALPAELVGTDKKGKEYIGLWGWKTIEKDAQGKVTKREAVLRKLTSWTPNKVLKVLAQAQELKK